MKEITVVLADDHELVRQGIKSVVTSSGQIKVIGEASLGDEALQVVIEKKPDVLITDISMPGISGLTLCEMITERKLPTHVLILSMHKDPEYVISAFEAGAKGYLSKDSNEKELHEAIRTISAGDRYMTNFVTTILANKFALGASKNSSEELTTREKEILAKIVSGSSNKQIAGDLFISSRTVDTHRTNIMKKLKANNAAELVRIAITQKVI